MSADLPLAYHCLYEKHPSTEQDRLKSKKEYVQKQLIYLSRRQLRRETTCLLPKYFFNGYDFYETWMLIDERGDVWIIERTHLPPF